MNATYISVINTNHFYSQEGPDHKTNYMITQLLMKKQILRESETRQ